MGDSKFIWHDQNVSYYFHDKIVEPSEFWEERKIDPYISKFDSKFIHGIWKEKMTFLYNKSLSMKNSRIFPINE